MTYDANPSFTGDKNRFNEVIATSQTLWKACGGDLSKIPQSYLDNMGFSYSDGSVSLLNLLNKVTLSDGTFEEFSEVVEKLAFTTLESWPNNSSILEIQSEKLLDDGMTEFDFSESVFEFAGGKDMSEKVEIFLRGVISTVYRDGVSSVTDLEGNPPNNANNYLMGGNGESFEGVFYENPEKSFNFKISKKKDGTWQIAY